jgi:hypothetical protein
MLEMASAEERSDWIAMSRVLRLIRPEPIKNNFH